MSLIYNNYTNIISCFCSPVMVMPSGTRLGCCPIQDTMHLHDVAGSTGIICKPCPREWIKKAKKPLEKEIKFLYSCSEKIL